MADGFDRDRFDLGDAHLDTIEAEHQAAQGATLELLRADPHPFGSGRVHVLDGDRTRCGKTRADCPGRLDRGVLDNVDCKACLVSLDAERRREEQRRRSERQRAEWQAKREQKNRAWWDWYDRYLDSPEWRQRRDRVLERAGGVCEGCLERRAVHVHHTTYSHVGAELLFELVAVCDDCHRRIHPDKWAA